LLLAGCFVDGESPLCCGLIDYKRRENDGDALDFWMVAVFCTRRIPVFVLSFSRERFLRLAYYFSAVPRKMRHSKSPRAKAVNSIASDLRLFGISGLPEIRKGEDLAERIVTAVRKARLSFEYGDILVVAQKIVSKAEGAVVHLNTVKPSPAAEALAAKLKKDARVVELVLRESRRILRSDRVLITETRHGFVCANAGIDHSNVPGEDVVTLLPRDPDRSAQELALALHKRTGKRVAVVISDTFGRPWRLGLTNVAIGAAGLPVLLDLRGTRDREGKPLTATILAVADELAAAAGLLMGKSEGTPAVLIRGYRFEPASEKAAQIIRPAAEDLFR
jgi:coenzyme F420-0:L-glutamate ligase / coenzyme F420-1:gamma-L-glutamate ligase